MVDESGAGAQRPIDLRHLSGPFDVIGDVHGCSAELEALLIQLGYIFKRNSWGQVIGAAHPLGRTVVFVGDLPDRGPDTPGVFRLAMGMVAMGSALCVAGNHDDKLRRSLVGRNVQLNHGLAQSLDQLHEEPAAFRVQVATFISGLPPHHLLDRGNLVVSHAGLPEPFHGEDSKRARRFCLYGEASGEVDTAGLPVRHDWAKDYRGNAMVLYGHTPVRASEWVNNTMCLDTGCVFGGWLTALRYPECDLVSVPAAMVYYEASKPFPANPGAIRADDAASC
jgi:protein phosphatase